MSRIATALQCRRFWRWFAMVVAVIVAMTGPAGASESPAAFGNFLNLSYAGNGTTPSAMSRFQDFERAIASPRAAIDATQQGDATYRIPLDLPPALLAPTLALVYSSARGDHTVVSRGWTLDVGMTIERIVDRSATQAYAGVPNVHRISGGGLDGILFRDGPRWQFVSTSGVAVHATYAGRVWTVQAGGVTTTLRAEAAQGPAPTVWRVTRMLDEHRNTVEFVWGGTDAQGDPLANRLTEIRYGGVSSAMDPEVEPHTTRLSFNYLAAGVVPTYAARAGFVDTVDRRLESITVEGAPFGASPARTYDLQYVAVEGRPGLDAVVVTDGATSVTLAEFEYAAYPSPTAAPVVDEVDASVVPIVLETSDGVDPGLDPGVSATFGGLYDVTGDGLLDAYQQQQRTLWPLTWNGATATWSRPILSLSVDQDRSESVRCADESSVVVATRRLVDIDNDGFRDLVETAAPVPDSYPLQGDFVPGNPIEADLCHVAYLQDGDVPIPEVATWTVRYGTQQGFETLAVEVDAPVPFLRVARPPRVDPFRASTEYPHWLTVDDASVDLLDVDNDGWLDIVETVVLDPFDDGTACARDDGVECGRMFVWYHDGFRDGGFDYDDFGLPAGWTGGSPEENGAFTVASERTTPTRLDAITWTMPNGASRRVDYGWYDNGLLQLRAVSGIPALEYGYDAWQRIATVASLGGPTESFGYDKVNNLTTMTRSADGGTWTYGAATFSEVPKRTWAPTAVRSGDGVLSGGVTDITDTQAWSQGRLDSITTQERGTRFTKTRTMPYTELRTQTLKYDGAGRVQQSTLARGTTVTSVTTYRYGVDDDVVQEVDGNLTTWRFQGFRKLRNSGTGFTEVIEKLTPVVSVQGDDLVWTFAEPDGHALATYESTGHQRSLELLGAYGAPLHSQGSSSWPIDGFHGSDPDRDDGLVPFGARHMLARGDGTWLQAEPLLYQGPTNGDLARPLGFVGVYASGNPNRFADPNGRYFTEVGYGYAGGMLAGWAIVAEGTGGLVGMSPMPGAQVASTALDSTAQTLANAAEGWVRLGNETSPMGTAVGVFQGSLGVAAISAIAPEAMAGVRGGVAMRPEPRAGMTRVGRWMSPDELAAMQSSGRVQAGAGGVHRVAVPADRNAYKAAPAGDVFATYDVPTDALKPAGNEGWRQIVGPDSIYGRLAAKKGQAPPELPAFENLEVPQ